MMKLRGIRDTFGIGMPDVIPSSGEAGYSTQYQAVYDAFGTPPDDAVADAQNTMVQTLVDSGVWAKLDVFYCLANNDEPNSLINWISPGTYDADNVGGTLFTAYEGFTGANNDYLSTNWIPSINGVNYTTNAASIFVAMRTGLTGVVAYAGGTNGAVSLRLLVINGTTIRALVNTSNAVVNFAVAGTDKYLTGVRTSNASVTLYRNSVPTVVADPSNAMPPVEPYLLARNNAGSPTNYAIGAQMSFAAFGGLLTAGDVANLESACEAYMDSNGKGLLP